MLVRSRGVPAVGLVVVLGAEQVGARAIDGQAQDGHEDRIIEADRGRVEQALERLDPDQDRDASQDHRAREAREVPYLAGAEDVARIVSAATRGARRRAR